MHTCALVRLIPKVTHCVIHFLMPLSLQISNAKISKLVGAEAKADTMENDVNAVIAFVVGSNSASTLTYCPQEN
jgi:hypothetical protein